MRDFLAEKLLAKIMSWTTEEISEERPLLQALASFKYNDYQQFSTGIKFIESLVRWLGQFNDLAERKVAYNFIKNKLIFISSEQIAYLVSITFNEKVKPILLEKTAKEININPNSIKQLVSSNHYKNNLRKSLFIGLSDGSRTDYFRRSSDISNEQILTTHEISNEKIDDMLNELSEQIGDSQKFNTVFLIDDFTASGKSYFRQEELKGKIYKFLSKVFNNTPVKNGENWNKLVEIEDLEIHILFYIATSRALSSIQQKINDWKVEKGINNLILCKAVQIIEESIMEDVISSDKFIEITKKYFNDNIIDKHYKKGKHDDPNLGFDECALPLILNHNTPNNSLPILWFPDNKDNKLIKGLFPRVIRHKE